MAKDDKIRLADFCEIAMSVKRILALHKVPEENHYSIVSDVIFEFANFLDTKMGSDFHEEIYALLDDYADKLISEVSIDDHVVADLGVKFGKKVIETNILRSHLDDTDSLKLDLEIALGVRSLQEIDKAIDAESRFFELSARRGGLKSLDFLPASDTESENWLSIPLRGSKYGNFDESLNGICACILRVTKQWL